MTQTLHLSRYIVAVTMTVAVTLHLISQTNLADSESNVVESSGKSTPTSHSNEIIAYWDVSDESNKKVIDHAKWQDILDKYLKEHQSGINRFDYKALKEDLERMESLIEYLLQLSELDPRTYSKSEQLSYWINLFNAATVYLVASQSPIKSIKDIKLGNSSPFEVTIAIVQDQHLSLNYIRNEILRPIWRDNRIHYALNSASQGCPNLAKKAYRADNVEELLEAGAKAYINHSRGVSTENDQLIVSNIYELYMEDFGSTASEVISHLTTYAEPTLAEQLKQYSKYETQYDWRVNLPE